MLTDPVNPLETDAGTNHHDQASKSYRQKIILYQERLVAIHRPLFLAWGQVNTDSS